VSKMLVVGEGGVGKTSTIKSLTGQVFSRSEESTHGLRIYNLDLDHPGEPDTSMKLSTWDFGGQQIYHATHQFFLTDRSLFLLLWNSRLGWEQGRMRYWLDIIAARAPESPVLLVATNAPCGGRPVDLPLDDLRREYPQIVTNIAVDNESRDGLDTLRSTIAQEAASLPLMGTEWPTRWLAAADAVRNTPAKHVTPSVMWRGMATAGLTDREHQRYVATALHQLGDILYYQDDPELAETVILKPEWVNEYISMVLDSPEVERRHGLLTRDHVNTLWADLDRGMRDHFLGMMERYDLSYHLDGGSPTDLCLVVERLPWNAPPYQEAWDQTSPNTTNHEIRVHYQLNTTPPGIPTWFIARSHRFTTKTHWRTGALLAHPDGRHRALIRTDNHRNVIELAVRGPSPASFCAVLNDGINVTLDRYPGLNVTRSAPCPCSGIGPDPCTELFDHDDLQNRLNRTPPRYDIECRKSGEDVYVPLLLLGLAPSERDELRTSFQRLSKTITAQHDDLAERIDDLSADMQRQFLKVQQQVKAGLETKCPSVFALTATKYSAIKGTKYRLHLYCEEPGAWHPLPVETSVYQITETAAWLQRFGHHLRILVDVLKHAAPLAGPVLGMTIGQISDRISADIDAMNALIDQIPDSFAMGSSFGRLEGQSPDPAAHGSTEADYRSLESLMTKLDPDRKWGGLSRVATPEGLTLYLCPTHAAPYERAPRAPGRD
jgi:internalin A